MSVTTAATISACSAGASTPFSRDHRRCSARLSRSSHQHSRHYHRSPPSFQPPSMFLRVIGVDLTSPRHSNGQMVPLITLDSGSSSRTCVSKLELTIVMD
ncbi:hypothetical protein PIB30_049666 [Stylosanthes scabra]|uniref:Uncharacterized protein n=1 Tax=Stylosanthes scabra TaxID=79078 RepID=A0ABU6UHQ4_9FABA|nr:hypothetical protein [Stylosanthes scabra]